VKEARSDQEQLKARKAAKKLTTMLTGLGFVVDEINFKESGLESLVTIDDIEVGSLAVLARFDPERLLEHVRANIISEVVINYLALSTTGNSVSFIQEAPLPDTTGLWRVAINNDEKSVIVVEYERDGRRCYEAF
jgi:hypothetical protein